QTTILAPGACARPKTNPGSAQHKLSPISQLPIEDPSGKAMLSFYSAMTGALSRCLGTGCPNVVRILHYGDSHVASGLFTGPLRANCRRDLGDGGPGFVFAGRPWSWYRPYAASLTVSSGWHADGLGQQESEKDGQYGLSGVSFTANAPGETTTLTAGCGVFDI